MQIVKDKWNQLTAFNGNVALKEQLLNEIITAYNSDARQYHNLHHVADMLQLCDEYLDQLEHPAIVGFAILYHDVVYDTQLRDNEEKSAGLARKHLKQLQFKKTFIDEVEKLVMATVDHAIPENVISKNDAAFFLDFDLAVLGSPAETYLQYSKSIRQEYLQYRTHVYKAGRQQAMAKLLDHENLFYTTPFRQRFEQQARENINNELAELAN